MKGKKPWIQVNEWDLGSPTHSTTVRQGKTCISSRHLHHQVLCMLPEDSHCIHTVCRWNHWQEDMVQSFLLYHSCSYTMNSQQTTLISLAQVRVITLREATTYFASLSRKARASTVLIHQRMLLLSICRTQATEFLHSSFQSAINPWLYLLRMFLKMLV